MAHEKVHVICENLCLEEGMTKGEIERLVGTVASGSPKGVYATAEALKTANPETGVYIVTSNGHIYSWTKNSTSDPIDLGVYQATGIEDGSVTAEKTDFVRRDNFTLTNMFDKDEVISAGFYDLTGTYHSATSAVNYGTTPLIPVYKQQTVFINNITSITTLWDKNGAFVRGVNNQKKIELAENEKFIRCAIDNNATDEQLNKMEINILVPENLKIDKQDMLNEELEYTKNKNVFDINKFNYNGFYAGDTGNFTNANTQWGYYGSIILKIPYPQTIANNGANTVTFNEKMEVVRKFTQGQPNLQTNDDEKFIALSFSYNNSTKEVKGTNNAAPFVNMSHRLKSIKNLYINSDNVCGLNEVIENKIENKSYRYRNALISIIGDSYSTYGGWIPDSYLAWYRDTGNDQTNNINNVNQTWWYKLIKDLEASLLVDCSYSGSTICNTGYSGQDATATSFITRMKTWIGEQRKTDTKPNVIFVFGGLNDTWANSPRGEVKYSNWTEDDLKEVLPAFCYMIDYLQKWNPGAKIINIVSPDVHSVIRAGMATACEHYGIKNIPITTITKESGHPNQTGMAEIEQAILSAL